MADYSINAVTRRVVFTGSAGVGPYAFSFEILDENDVAVYFNDAVLTITTDYTVTINANGTGSVTIVTGTNVPSTPTASDQIVIVGARDIERVTDFVTAGDLLASSLNEQLDALTIFDQQIAEENKRGMRAPVFDPALVEDGGVVDMTLPAKASRAGKTLAFDSDGNPVVGEDIGNFRGDWAAGTSYTVRDLVKDASNGNIYRVNTAHTSSGSTPLSSNADIAKFDLVVDAASATDSANDAEKLAINAEDSQFTLSDGTTTGFSALHHKEKALDAQTAASTAQTAAETAQTAAETAQTAAETAQTAAETAETNAETAQTAAETALDDFTDIFLGSKATDPTVDNDGDALVDGALYFDTTNNVLKVYDLGNTQWNQTTPSSSDQTNINTVAGISANVTTVAGISANVTTVAGISSDVTTVAADGTDIGTVAGISANVTTVAGVSSDVTTVAGISSDVTTVAADGTDIGTVAGISANVTTVAGVSADVTTVAGISANVTTVATNDANVTTVASNITGVNSFAERYRVEASDPTTSLDAGDLAFVTGSSTLKYYDGSAWQGIAPGITSVSADSSPSLGGNLDVAGNSIVSSSDGDISITPNGTGSVIIDGLSHPQSDGSAGQFLKTDGAGQLSFDTVSVTPSIPSGSLMLFQQTAAPTGWTKQTTHDNKALRVVSGTAGSGGSSGFTTALGTPSLSGSTGNTTLSTAQLASHNHTIDGRNVNGAAIFTSTSAAFGRADQDSRTYMHSTNPNNQFTNNQLINNSGSNSAHSHTMSGTASINVQYVDLIIASKD